MKTFCRVGIPAPNNQLISSAKCQRALGGLVMGLLDNSRAPCEVSREIEYDEQRAIHWVKYSSSLLKNPRHSENMMIQFLLRIIGGSHAGSI